MSIKEIKNITGYSYSTISRVLSGKAAEFRISRGTCQKILEAAERLNYRPNILARSLRLQKSMTIGLIVSDIQNPFFGEMASRIEGLLRRHGYSTILCNTNEIPENEEFYLKVLTDRQVDGIIITPIHTAEWPTMESLGRQTPVVLIDRIFYETELPWVTSENTAAAERVTCELIALGYRRIAFLGGPPETYITDARYKGYAKAMTDKFGGVDESLVLFQGYSVRDGEEVLERLFERRADTEAVVCVNNLVFFGAAKIANRLEMRLGRPMMMAGFDIGEYSNLFKWPLISADQNLAELARGAVRLLLPRVSDTEIKDTHLVVPITVNKYRLLDFSY